MSSYFYSINDNSFNTFIIYSDNHIVSDLTGWSEHFQGGFCVLLLFIFVLETGSCYVGQAGLLLTILLPQLSKCRDLQTSAFKPGLSPVPFWHVLIFL
jgi:hypothetical protein